MGRMPKVIKGKILEKKILKEGIPGQNFNGGHYDEVMYILKGEDGRLYLSYWSSADFDYCPLWGAYTQCTSCNWWWERWLPCEDCDRSQDCRECVAKIYSCQNPDLVLIQTEKGIFEARLLEKE